MISWRAILASISHANIEPKQSQVIQLNENIGDMLFICLCVVPDDHAHLWHGQHPRDGTHALSNQSSAHEERARDRTQVFCAYQSSERCCGCICHALLPSKILHSSLYLCVSPSGTSCPCGWRSTTHFGVLTLFYISLYTYIYIYR